MRVLIFLLLISCSAQQETTTEGELVVDAIDYRDGREEIAYYIKAGNERKRVDMKGRSGKPNAKIRLTQKADEFEVLEIDELYAQDAAITSGPRSVLVYMVKFADASPACLAESVSRQIGGADEFYLHQSKGAISFHHGIVDVSIDAKTNDCDYYKWATLADEKANEKGYAFRDFNHRIYIVPKNPNCSWAGVANVNGPRVWVQDCGWDLVYPHEIGHNLGFRHASTSTSAYGDQSDPMSQMYREFNAPHREQGGWLEAEDIALVADGQHELLPLNASSGGLKTLKVKRGASEHYYVSYRVASGAYDSALASTYAGKMNVHRFTGSGQTYFVGAFTEGQSFTDTDYNVTFKNAGVKNGRLGVEISSPITSTPQETPISAPSGLTARMQGKNLNLSWHAVSGAASYIIYVNNAVLTQLTANKYSTKPTKGTWAFHVVAVSATGTKSGNSNSVTVTIK